MTPQPIAIKYLIMTHMLNPKGNIGMNDLLPGASPTTSQWYGLKSTFILIKLYIFNNPYQEHKEAAKQISSYLFKTK